MPGDGWGGMSGDGWRYEVPADLVVVSAPEDDHHDTGPGHPERPERVRAALAGIDAAGLGEAVRAVAPRLAADRELARVHRQSYLDAMRAFCRAGGGAVDPDTMTGPGSWDTAVQAAGGALSAVEALRRGNGQAALVAMRPPGHHATSDQAMGFCLLNNVAVAAASLVEAGERVMVVDWDVHHGNGTQSIFWDDPRVLYVSTHQSPLFPGTGRAEETGGPGAPGSTINIPLPAGATGDVLLAAFDHVVAPAAERFAPGWVLVSAGYDGHRRDPLADLRLTAGDYADLTTRVQAMAPGPGRTVLVLEGGYDVEAVTLSVGASAAALLGHPYRPEAASNGGPGKDAVAAAERVHHEVAGRS